MGGMRYFLSRLGRHPFLTGSIVCQGIAITIALSLPFGFDHPSSLGLDFGHFLLILSLYAIALAVGVVIAFATRRFLLAFVQLAVPVVIVFLGFAGILHI
jgi:hypothetical protein